MDFPFLKEITDAGIGLGSLVLLTFIILNQNKTIRSQNTILQSLNRAMDKNTIATSKLSEKIERQIKTDTRLVESGAYCKIKVPRKPAYN